jgi:AcrR family transcriptional regulator
MSKRAEAMAEKDGRERILAVAIRSFSEVGYEGTTTAGVARDAEVTQPLVHHHFGSKHGLWEAAMDELFASVPTITASVDPTAAPLDQLVAGATQFVRFAAARPEVTRIIAREGAAPSPRLTYLVERYLRGPMKDLVAAMRAGQRSGAIDAELRPELLLFFVLGAGSHLFDVTAFAKESLGIDTTASRTREDFVALLERMLRGGIAKRSSRGPAASRARRD